MKVPHRLKENGARLPTDRWPVAAPVDASDVPTAEAMKAVPSVRPDTAERLRAASVEAPSTAESMPAAPAEAPGTAESMRSVSDADIRSGGRGWFSDSDKSRAGDISLWDADETPLLLPEEHPDRSTGLPGEPSIEAAVPADADDPADPDGPSLWSRSTMFQASLALLGLFFVTAPTGLTLGLKALDEARDPCRVAEAPVAAFEAERAALLVERIWAAPDTTSCLLASHGMDRDSFLGLMDDIASDRVLARDFEDARAVVRAQVTLGSR